MPAILPAAADASGRRPHQPILTRPSPLVHRGEPIEQVHDLVPVDKRQRRQDCRGWDVKLPAPIVRLCKDTLMKAPKARTRNELLPGTLEMLILKTLSIESMHGYGIAQHIQMLSADVLRIEEGSLYPALQRMLVKGWVVAEWKSSANNRRARFYRLTPAGRKQLGVEESRFSHMFGAIMRVMKTT
jgi:PadR family transcriptional regulator PadR